MKSWVLGAIVFSLCLGIVSPAEAGHYCREKARDLSSEVASTTNLDEAKAAFQSALEANPECDAEIRKLATWYEGGGTPPFPFPKDEDPTHGFLGPIGWWWNIIYAGLFDRNTVLMVLFGWELFLIPFGIAWGLVGMTFGLLSDLVNRGQPET